MTQLGVHSEAGKLRTVLVCRPGLAHQRLTPSSCRDLLFADVIRVQEAQKDHCDCVLELHDVLAVDRRITANAVGIGAAETRLWPSA